MIERESGPALGDCSDFRDSSYPSDIAEPWIRVDAADLEVETPGVLEPAVEQGARRAERWPLVPAICISLVLHGVLAIILLSQRIAPAEVEHTPAFGLVSVRLLPPPDTESQPTLVNSGEPVSAIAVEADQPAMTAAPVSETMPEALLETATEVAADSEAAPEQPGALPEPVEPQLVETPMPVLSAPGDSQSRTRITIPSIEAVRSSIAELNNAQRARLWQRNCTRRQEESELLDCEPEPTADYSRQLVNPTYRSLNPLRQISRSQRAAPAIAANTGDLRQQLQAMTVPGGLPDYLIQELEAGISHQSNTGNQSLQNMSQMVERSATAQFSRQILDDAWVQLRRRELRQRRVHLDR